jgi:streptomycin 6-kinase
MDTLSGSFGLTGASDTNMVLERAKASTAEAVLHIAGRDVEATELALTFSPELMSWNILGQAHEVMATTQQQVVYDAIKEGCSSPAKVQKETGLKRPNINKIFKKLTEAGKLRKIDHGEYTVVDADDPIQRTSRVDVPF